MKIKKINKNIPLPAYQTAGAVGMDLYCSEDTQIAPRSIKNVPAGIVVKVPDNYMMLIRDRSSIPKKGLIVTSGVIDQDYCGEEDEIHVQFFNYTDEWIEIKECTRIANAIILPIARVGLEEVENMSDVSRGGFGSTGDR